MTKETLIDWMTKYGHSVDWLADKCEVRPKTVSSWRSDRPIPAKAIIIIQGLMTADTAASEAKTPHSLVLEFEDEDYAPIEQKALSKGMTIREWAKQTLNEIANEDVEKLAERIRAGKVDLSGDRPKGTRLIVRKQPKSSDHTGAGEEAAG